MKQLTINASPRQNSGSASSGRLRLEGKVPAVVYGKSKAPANLTVDASELRVVLLEIGNNTPLVKLKEGDAEPRTSIIKEVQRDPIKRSYVHVDFQEVADDELISIEVPVHHVGESWGVKNENGTLEIVSHSVLVRCLPSAAPSYVEVDVSDLKVGDSLHISQLPAIEGVQYLDHPEQPVISVNK